MMNAHDTRAQILDTARDLLAAQGVAGLSFDKIAKDLGRSKQAVLYWFPSKSALLAALFLPWLEAEAEAATAAVASSETDRDAIAEFVRAMTAFHLSDLDRFRMMYAVPQTIPVPSRDSARPPGDLLTQVNQTTDRVYGALAERLAPNPSCDARQQAFVIHSAVLGLVLMISLAEAVEDPLKHRSQDLVEALIGTLTCA